MLKRFRLSVELLLVLAVLITHLWAVFAPPNSLMGWFTSDDAFYYFKPAQNITEGRGPTFDGIGQTNGFHPLWMLVCIPVFALARFDLIVPLRIVVFLLALLNAGSAVLLYRIAKKALSEPVSVFLAFFWAFSSSVHAVTTMLGMESGVNAFTLLLLLYLLIGLEDKRRAGTAALRDVLLVAGAAALALLARLDNIFLISLAGLWVVFREKHLRALLLGDIVLLAGAVFGAYLIRLDFDRYYYYAVFAPVMAGAAVAVKLLTFMAFGLYDRQKVMGLKGLLRTVLAVGVSSAVLTGVMLALVQLGVVYRFPRITLVYDALLTLPLVYGLRRLVWAAVPARVGAEQTEEPLFPGLFRRAWRSWLQRGLAYYGVVFGVLGVYMLYNLATLGTPSPVSGQIKRWWGEIYTVYGRPAETWPDLLALNPARSEGPWIMAISHPRQVTADISLLVRGKRESRSHPSEFFQGLYPITTALLVGAVAVIIALRWKTFTRLFTRLHLGLWLAGCLFQVGSYKLTGYVATHDWYWVSEMVWVALSIGVLLESLVCGLRGRREWALVTGLSGLLSALLVVTFTWSLVWMIPWNVRPGEEEGYLAGARGLEAVTPPGAVIGSTGGGGVGYFIQGRTIVNLDGLINSNEYFQLLKTGQANQYLDRIGMDYVYGARYVLTFSEPYKYMFENRLVEQEEIAGTMLYRYQP